MIAALPMALGIALSPFPVVPAILLLFTARPRATAGSFLLGWLLGVGTATGVAVLLADLVAAVETTPTWVSWARLVLGVLLVAYGVRQWFGRGGEAEPPGWMRTLQDATPRRALGLGLVLSLANPKILLLAVAGGLTVGAETVGPVAEVLAVLAFTAVASLTVAAPLAAYVVGGSRVLEPLARMRDWLERNNDAVMAVVLVVLGALLAVKGVQGL